MFKCAKFLRVALLDQIAREKDRIPLPSKLGKGLQVREEELSDPGQLGMLVVHSEMQIRKVQQVENDTHKPTKYISLIVAGKRILVCHKPLLGRSQVRRFVATSYACSRRIA